MEINCYLTITFINDQLQKSKIQKLKKQMNHLLLNRYIQVKREQIQSQEKKEKKKKKKKQNLFKNLRIIILRFEICRKIFIWLRKNLVATKNELHIINSIDGSEMYLRKVDSPSDQITLRSCCSNFEQSVLIFTEWIRRS